MHFKAVALVLSVATLVSAGATPAGSWNSSEGKCNVGELKCCNSVQSPTSKLAIKQLGLVNAAVGDIQGLVGLNCSPLSAGIGLGGNNCNASPTCCSGNNFSGLVVLGCSPIIINL